MRRTALFERLVRLMHRIYGATRHGRVDDIVSTAPSGSIQSLERKRLCAVATYKRDGSAVVTPVWFGLSGDHIYFRAEKVSGKAKRLARNGRVLVAPCTQRGRPLGPPFSGEARILEGSDAQHAEKVIQANFGRGRSVYESWFTLPDGVYVEVVPIP
jgi:uncharacterized protein